MWSVQYAQKYNTRIFVIPCADEAMAKTTYDLIKSKLGVDPYQLHKDKETQTVEIVHPYGATTVDCKDVMNVWMIDEMHPVVEKWRKYCDETWKDRNRDGPAKQAEEATKGHK